MNTGIVLNSLTNVMELCRLCLSQDDVMVPIFDAKNLLFQRIMDCVPIQIEKNDGLPGLICQLCSIQIEKWLEFREQCEKSDHSIRKFLKSQKDASSSKTREIGVLDECKRKKRTLIKQRSTSKEAKKARGRPRKVPDNITSVPSAKPVQINEDQLWECSEDIQEGEEESQKQRIKLKIRSCSVHKDIPLQDSTQPPDSQQNFEFPVKYDKSDSDDDDDKDDDWLNWDEETEKDDSLLFDSLKEDTCTGELFPDQLKEEKITKNVVVKKDPEKITKNLEFPDQLKEEKLTKHLVEKKDPEKIKTVRKRKRKPEFEDCFDGQNYVCQICGNVYEKKNALKRHAMSHTDEKRFLCNICGKGFKKKDHFDVHIIMHTGEKQHMCSLCGNSFTWKQSLQVHLRLHTEERPFKCGFCEKAFRWKTELAKHMRRHTGEKPYSCPYCSRCFSDKWNMTQHIRLHTGDKPYKCKICNAQYTHNVTLRNHIRQCHTVTEQESQHKNDAPLDMTNARPPPPAHQPPFRPANTVPPVRNVIPQSLPIVPPIAHAQSILQGFYNTNFVT